MALPYGPVKEWATESAVELLRDKDRAAATEMAGLISDPRTRQNMLKKIGPHGPQVGLNTIPDSV